MEKDEIIAQRMRDVLEYLARSRTKNGKRANFYYSTISADTSIKEDKLLNILRLRNDDSGKYLSTGNELELRKIIEVFHSFIPYEEDPDRWGWVVEYLPEDSSAAFDRRLDQLERIGAEAMKMLAELQEIILIVAKSKSNESANVQQQGE